jgi:uncharacterized protein (DUF2225 family)
MDINLLKSISDTKNYADGEVIVYEGEIMGNEMFILLQGQVNVVKNFGSDDAVTVAELKPGAFFGEMTLFLNKERLATVVADGAVIVRAINRMDAYNFFESQPNVSLMLINSLTSRLESVCKMHDENAKIDIPEILKGDPEAVKESFKAQPEAAYMLIKTLCEKIEEANNKFNPAAETASVDTGLLSEIVPEAHKRYDYKFLETDKGLVFSKNIACALCGYKSSIAVLKSSGLRLEQREKDFRPRYKNGDTVPYDVISCKSCGYSAFTTDFEKTIMPKFKAKQEEISRYKSLVEADYEPDEINGVFTRLYLTIKSSEIFFLHPHLPVAKAWLRLYWLYQDCKDEEMIQYSLEKARESYMTVFEKVDISADNLQQILLTIGELSFRLDDIATAKKFLFQAKTDKNGTTVLSNQAEDRLNDIKNL